MKIVMPFYPLPLRRGRVKVGVDIQFCPPSPQSSPTEVRGGIGEVIFKVNPKLK
jgi:hypothetical protein